MEKCPYCERKPKFGKYGYDQYNSETNLAEEPYTSLTIGVDESGKIYMDANGEYFARYFPKYCPECGRRLP